MKTKRKKRAEMPVELGTEVDLEQLRESTKKIYETHREKDEDDFPPERRQEYWRNRYFARTAWEHAENAAFANLVDEQKSMLPALAASNAKLARDVQATADALAMLKLVSTSLSVLAEVITLLSRVVPK
jgi:hypothetical protein